MALRFGDQSLSPSGLLFSGSQTFVSTADSFGAGAVQAQAAAVAGLGIRTAVDLGTPPEFEAGAGTVVGVGEVIHVGSGALQAQDAAVVGVGADSNLVIGSGALQAQDVVVAGVGSFGVGGIGVLVAQPATVVGFGALEGRHFGTGILVAQDAILAATGERIIKGAGNLVSQPMVVAGTGILIEIAVDYICYLPPNSLDLQVLSIGSSYAEQFTQGGEGATAPLSVTVGWDDLTTYHGGNPPESETAYEFSNDKEFVEDQNE